MLQKFLRDELPEEEDARVDHHLGACASCQGILDGLIGPLPPELISSSGDSAGEEPPTLEGYETLGLVAEGGMGEVWRVRDLELGRVLAVKVLKPSAGGDARTVERFVAEARITGRLAHPFIVPVHRMGQLTDGRPCYTMKLVQGRTLAELLADRADLASGRAEFVRIFSQVCQALAYAHGEGIIHRDLKPHNVMVGAHGEVQLMDWGLAKVLGGADPLAVEDGGEQGASADTRHDGGRYTRTGSVLGTLAYMPPEQAQGQVDQVDRRADVFGLGAILCEVLTGEPPYTGPDARDVRLAATEARLEGARSRLRNSGADPELIQLAERCLAARKSDRPADAVEVAATVTAYQAAVQERWQQERLERERRQVKAEEERRRRKLWVSLVAAVLAAVSVAAAAGLYWQRQEAQRWQALASAENDMRLADGQLSAGRITEAGESITRAGDRLSMNAPEATRYKHEQLEKAWRLASTLEQIQWDRTTPTIAGLFDNDTAQRRYEQAFAEAGLYLDSGVTNDLVEMINRSPVRHKILEAVDNWALVCAYDMRALPAKKERHETRRDLLLELARELDPDLDLRSLIRNPRVWGDRRRLEALAQRAQQDKELTPRLAAFLAELLRWADGDPEPLLRTFQARHREDFWLNYDLGKFLQGRKPAEAMQFYQAALAVRPHHVFALDRLGIIYLQRGEAQAAIALFEEVLTKHPTFDFVRIHLGDALRSANRLDEAFEQYRRCSLGAFSQDAFLALSLGEVLEKKGKFPEATEQYRSALLRLPQLNATDQLYIDGKEVGKERVEASIHKDLGDVLVKQKNEEGAIRAYRDAVRLWPGYVEAHRSLGNLLANRGKRDEALKELNKAIDVISGKERLELRVLRTDSRVRTGRVADAVAEVAELTAPGANATWSARQWYDFACVYSVASGKIAREEQEYQDRAMELLRRAVRAGWNDAAHMAKNTDLDPLRGREDFKNLLDSLPRSQG